MSVQDWSRFQVAAETGAMPTTDPRMPPRPSFLPPAGVASAPSPIEPEPGPPPSRFHLAPLSSGQFDVVFERDALRRRLLALEADLTENRNIPGEDRTRLAEQLVHMKGYQRVLNERIGAFAQLIALPQP